MCDATTRKGEAERWFCSLIRVAGRSWIELCECVVPSLWPHRGVVSKGGRSLTPSLSSRTTSRNEHSIAAAA